MYFCEIDDNWYHESNTSQCPFDNETYPTHMMVEASDGTEVFEGNLEEYEQSILVVEEEMEEVIPDGAYNISNNGFHLMTGKGGFINIILNVQKQFKQK